MLFDRLFDDGPTREQAQRLAQQELDRSQYDEAKPSLVVRAVQWLLDRAQDVIDSASRQVGDGLLARTLFIALLIGIAVVVLIRIGPLNSRQARRGALFDDDGPTTAAQHRRAAEAYAGSGEFAQAVRERLRAIVRELEARGVLDPRPGRTAGEVARDAGATVAALAQPLHEAAHTFDEIWYGERPADAAAYALLVGVDGQVTSARLVGT